MGIRESIKGKSFRRNTDSVDQYSGSSLNSQQLVAQHSSNHENSPAAITPTKEEPIVIVSPSQKRSSLLTLLRRMWQTMHIRDFLGMGKNLLKNNKVIRAISSKEKFTSDAVAPNVANHACKGFSGDGEGITKEQ